MKSYITKCSAGIIALSLIVGSASIALARENESDDDSTLRVQVTASTSVRTNKAIRESREEEREDIKDIRDDVRNGSTTKAEGRAEIKTKRVETRIEIKTKLDEKRKNNVKKVIDNRISAHRKHINQLSNRIVRIEKVIGQASSTASTTIALSALAEAKVKLTHASSTLATINANTSTTIASGNPGTQLQSVKAQFDSVYEDIKAAHQKINEAIRSLKGLSLKVKAESYGTTTTN